MDAEDTEAWDEDGGVGMVIPGGDCLRHWRRGFRAAVPNHHTRTPWIPERVEPDSPEMLRMDINPLQPLSWLDIINDR